MRMVGNHNIRGRTLEFYPHGIETQSVSKTAAYTITAFDDFMVCDATTAAFTVTLPPIANVIEGKEYNIKKIDSSTNIVTVAGDGAETIDGAATVAIGTQYESITIKKSGTNWWII